MLTLGTLSDPTVVRMPKIEPVHKPTLGVCASWHANQLIYCSNLARRAKYNRPKGAKQEQQKWEGKEW